MNPITNSFEPLSPSADGPGRLLRPDGTPVPTHWMQISVGEVVTVKGCGFTVKYIGEKTLLLEPVTPADVATELAAVQAEYADVMAARLRKRSEHVAMDAELHPDGRCSCAGEGTCRWCWRHGLRRDRR